MTKVIEVEVHALNGSNDIKILKFNDDINLIWGMNGGGKTSMLRIIDAALSNDGSIVEQVAFLKARVRFWSEKLNLVIDRTIESEGQFSKKHHPRRVFLQSMGESDDPFGEITDTEWISKVVGEGVVDEEKLSVPYLHQFLPISRLNELQVRRTRRRGRTDWHYEDYDFEAGIANAWRQYTSESLMEIREIHQAGLGDILSILFQSSSGESSESTVDESESSAYELVHEFLSDQARYVELDRSLFERKYSESNELRRVVQRIRRVEQQRIAATKAQAAFEKVINELYSGNKSLVFDKFNAITVKTATDEALSVEILSSGEKQILQILLSTLCAESSTILIDEPELSLHVDWQAKIVNCIQEVNPRCQIILATHSPEIIGRLPEDKIFAI